MEIGKIEFNKSSKHKISNEELIENAYLKGFIKAEGMEKDFEEYKKKKSEEAINYILDRN